ncbi:hypothetical protein SALBM217S_02938 [Streptomyces griseoloalbus]
MLIVPWFRQMLTLDLVDTYAAVILPQTVAPVMVFILKKHFDTLPRELEEAARLDGAGHARIFWSVMLPLSRPMLAAVAIFVFIGAWNNFLWPFVSTSDPALMTLPVGITAVKDAYGVNYAQTMASSVLAALPLVLVFVFFQRHIVKSVATTGLGGRSGAPPGNTTSAPRPFTGRGALVGAGETVQPPTTVLSVSFTAPDSSARRSMPLVVFSGFSLMNTTVSSASSAHGVATRNRSAVATP